VAVIRLRRLGIDALRRAGFGVTGPLLLLAVLARPALALTVVMNPWNGSDGPYTDVSMDGNTIHQGTLSGGNYSGFQYYQRPAGTSFAVGATLYLEVDYKDLGGPGSIGAQYNAVGNDFQQAGMVLGTSVQNTGGYKTGVMRLDNNNFHYGENGGNDLRLTHTQNLQFNIKEVRVSDTPTAAYLAATAFMGPYTGPTYTGGTPVDATTFTGKMYVGYQGWFRTPGDDDDVGWQHWTRSWGNMAAGLISEDFWPQMDELTAAERHAATGYTYPSGAQAELFSSDNARTVLRHFQWMEAYGIDGAAVQRFTNGLASPSSDSYRVVSHVRAAANQTGRTYYIEYDMTGTPENQLVSNISSDWHTLVDSLQLPGDGRYLHNGGLPVVGVYGFFPDRFSTATANAILDIFQNGPSQYRAFVAGAGAWYWRTDSNTTPQWQTMLYRLGSWQPWNAGNYLGTYPNYTAKTDYWAADKADFNAHGVIYQPEIYPGASSANRDGVPFNTPDIPRQTGSFLWQQFAAAYNTGFQTVFLGMFDELDEGTQILKVTDNYPTQSSFKSYEGQPSDCYLCYAGLGAQMLKGQMAYTTTKPNCPGLSEPSIPDPVSPLNGAVISSSPGSFSWTAALALPGGGSLSRYDVWLDGTVINVGLTQTASLALTAGNHVWRVRAVNSLGNAGGWSIAQSFSFSVGPTATRTPTPGPSFTFTATPSPTATRTAVTVGNCGIQAEDYVAYYDTTPGNSGGQYRNDDVDIETCGDIGGGYDVGWTDNGEWLEYLLNVPSSGVYNFSLRVASPNTPSGTVQLSIDGSNIGPQLTIPNTGAWQTYQDLTLNAQTLNAGIRRLRVSIVTGGFNFNYVCILPAATPTPSVTATATGTASASPTVSPSVTASATRSASPTATPTASASNTPSVSPSRTPSATPSITVQNSATPTATASATPTSSPSRTVSGTPSVTPLNSATASPTLSATASVTPTSSPSRTVSGTPSVTPLNSATASPTLSATASVTPSPSPSRTPSGTASTTPSATESSSPSRTPSTTPSATASVTPSATRSATPTLSQSPSPSVTVTFSQSPSDTTTATPVPTGSSATPTPTVTDSFTVSPTASETGTATPSESPSASPTASPSASPSVTLSASPSQSPSPSSTATPSQTPSMSPSVSPSASVTLSGTPSSSPTLSPLATSTATPTTTATRTLSTTPSSTATVTVTASSSASPTATASVSPSATPSATQSASPSPSRTASALPSATLTPSISVSSTLTFSATQSPSPVPSATSSPVPGASPTQTFSPTPMPVPTDPASPRILQVRPFPNPNPKWLSVEIQGLAQQLRVRIYSPARVLVAEMDQAVTTSGWNRVSLLSLDLSPGLWHYEVDLGAGDPYPVKGSFFIIR
jgi:hypothetical protein